MIPLKSTTTVLKITSVDEHVLIDRYNSRCMECANCDDNCCHYGCPVDVAEIANIVQFKDELEQRTGVPAMQWFIDETEPREGFPSDEIVRTRVINNRCVFLGTKTRGCHLHALALEKGMDPHDIKPLICFLFPLTWDKSCLYVSEFLNELPCRHAGDSILDAQTPELRKYLGDAFVEEVKQLQASTGQKPPTVV